MNHTYRVVYNESTNTYVAVAEFEPSKGKSKSSKKAVAVAVALAAAQLVPLTAQAAVSIGSTSGTSIRNTATVTDSSNAVAVGSGASATGIGNAVAVGYGASAEGTDVAVGPNATATGSDNIAIGNHSKASSPISNLNYGIIAIGNQSNGSASEVVAIGQLACATASQAVALGSQTKATGDQSVAIGGNTVSSGASALAIGGDDLDKASKVGRSTNGEPNTTDSEINKGAVNTEFRKISGQDLVKKTDGSKSTNNTDAQYMSTNAYGAASIAVGIQARSGDLATAFGTQSFATGLASTALGVASNASGNGSIAIGPGTDAIGEQSIGMGANATSNNSHSIAIGTNATASGNQSISIGYANNVSGNNSGAFGDLSTITGSGAYTVGNNNTMAANEAGAFGNLNNFTSAANYSRAVGNRNNVSGSNTMVLGNNITAATNGSVVLGNSSSGSMSVVTCSSATVNGITYGNFTGNVTGTGKYVSVGASAADARKIVNVAAGNISATSTEAINGSQLYLTQDIIANVANSTAKALSPNSTYDANGSIKPNITVKNGSSPVSGISNVETAIATAGWQLQANGSRVDDINAGDVVNFASNDGTVKVTGTAGSTIDLSVNTTTLSTNANGTINGSTAPNKLVNATTVANAINKSGWNVYQGNTTTSANKKGLVNPGDNVVFANGKGTTASVENDGTNTTIKYDVAVDGTTIKVNSAGQLVATGTADGNTITTVENGVTTSVKQGGTATNPTYTVEVNKAGVNTTPTSTTEADNVTINTNGVAAAPTNNAGNRFLSAADTVNLVNNISHNITIGRDDAAFTDQKGKATSKVKAGDTIALNAGKNLIAKQNGNNITFATADDVTFNNVTANNITVATGTVGSPITITSSGISAGNQKISNVSSNLPATYNTDATYNPKKQDVTKKYVLPTNLNVNNAATVGDVLNAGWNLQGNGQAVDFVKPYDTVNFVNGGGTTATVTPSLDGKTSSISYNVAVDNKTTQLISVDASGNPLVQAANGNYYPAGSVEIGGKYYPAGSRDDGTGKVVDSTGAPVKPLTALKPTSTQVAAKTTALDVSTKPTTANNNTPAGKVVTPTNANGSSLVNATTVANAINNSGFTLTAQGNNGSVVNPGETVDMRNTDKNIVISKDAANNNVVYNLAKDITVDSVTAGNTTVNNAGVTITGSAADPTKTVSLTNGGLNNGGNKITNVAAGEADTDAVNVSQLKSQVAASKETVVSKNQTVRIKEGTNATGGKEFDLSVNTGKSLTINSTTGAIDVKTDDKTIKQGSTGALEVVTTNLTVANNGKVDTPTNGSSLVNATTVANAINNSGWNLQANGDTASKVSPGNTVQFINGDNIDITRNGNNITVATSKDINVKGDLTVAGNTTVKNFTVNPNSTVNMGGNKITNVAAGEADTDAVNVSQLKSRVAASKEEVTSNDKTVRINVSTNATTGANIYDVSVNTGKSLTINSTTGAIDVKTDGTTIKQGSTGALEVVTTNLTVANNGKVDTPTNGSSLVNATTVANAINNSGWNLQANGDTASKVSPGNTVQFLNGGNIDIKRDGNNITVATSKNINVAGDLTVAGNTTVKNFTVNPNSTVNMGGNKVQGVAAGVISANSTDAINGSQLYYTNQAIGANINNVANNLNARINDVADDADAGTASAMATAGVPQAYLPGKSMVAVGASTYRGKQGYAVGFSAISDSGNWIVKGTASGNSRGHFGATVGAGYQW
ncbi:YadA-like family protein [Kingella kingae]|uniref:YadA-like family protein n=1 Tax=Kingella kingae TaxID=504 RepID=UPI003AB416ED